LKFRVESDQKKGRMPGVTVSQSCRYTVLLGASALRFASTAQRASYGRQATIGKANLKRKQSKGSVYGGVQMI